VGGFSLFPRGEKFYAHFVAMGAELTAAARMLEEMLASDPPESDKAEELKEIEHRCDFLTHQMYLQLHRRFAIPIDREDIHAIAASLDDVMDSIEATAAFVRLYNIQTVRPEARELARIISASTVALALALRGLQAGTNFTEHVVEVNRLENEADQAHRQAVMRLFEEEKDPIALLKWNDILNCLEDTTDRCEDVADVLGGIVVKHG
jgi:uncharacterized protein